MTKREILQALEADVTLLAMLATEIGEAALSEPGDDDGGRCWHEIGVDCIGEMLTWPLDDGAKQ